MNNGMEKRYETCMNKGMKKRADNCGAECLDIGATFSDGLAPALATQKQALSPKWLRRYGQRYGEV